MSQRTSGIEWGLLAAIVTVVLLVTVGTANQYGATYDEPHYASAGVAYAGWWTRALTGDLSAFQRAEIERAWSLNHEHPPLQKCASGFSQRWFPAGPLGGLAAMRLPSAIWFALTIAAIYLFTRRIWGRRAALFGALSLAVMPRVVAHAHFNALDMPIACWFFITAAMTAEALRRNSWKWAALAGICFGLALMSKLNAFFVPVLLLPWGLVYYRDRWPKLVVALAIIGPAVFMLGWPWLWIDFVPHVREYLAFHLRHADYNIWYLGKLWADEPAPWHYPFVLTAVTTPALVLGLSLVGVVRGWPRRGVSPEATLLLCGLLIALLPNALPNSPKYNGVRLFLPAFPFLAALAGGGFAWLQSKVTALLKSDSPDRARLAPLVAAALGAIFLLPGLSGAARTHPYQLAYYNSLVGGTMGATERG
ncbi:MAG: glycosyltransferase family 39 protein, partial [Armatimonadetes bacterium]|nr:glycosyltransferase family 39 protein [Armatimonadota bacterium]